MDTCTFTYFGWLNLCKVCKYACIHKWSFSYLLSTGFQTIIIIFRFYFGLQVIHLIMIHYMFVGGFHVLLLLFCRPSRSTFTATIYCHPSEVVRRSEVKNGMSPVVYHHQFIIQKSNINSSKVQGDNRVEKLVHKRLDVT